MKSAFLLCAGLVSLSLTACDVDTSGKFTSPEPAPQKTKIVDSYSSSVRVDLVQFPEGLPRTVPQISIVHEYPSPGADQEKFRRIYEDFERLLGSRSKTYYSVGCGESVTLPRNLDVDVLEFCGEISLPPGELLFRANKIVFNNAQISMNTQTFSEQDVLEDFQQTGRLILITPTIEVVGENSLVVQGLGNNSRRLRGASVLLRAWRVVGDGHMEIKSLKGFRTE